MHVDGMEQSFFSDAIDSLYALIEEYQHLDATKDRLIPDALRLNIVSWGLCVDLCFKEHHCLIHSLFFILWLSQFISSLLNLLRYYY